MKRFIMITAMALGLTAASAQSLITHDKLVNASISNSGEIIVVPSATSSARDFDFLGGKWTLDNRKLKTRLNGCTEWAVFQSTDEDLSGILQGVGNLDFYRTAFDGKPYEGVTLRLFNSKTKLWSLYWVASDVGVLDPPVVGSFENGIGLFYGWDTFQGRKILLVYRWDKTDPDKPVWSQAFSTDNGNTWEWNYTNTWHRVK